ncbi:MAG: hypothetical protein GF335_04305 [Candidatus Moranbacteria bacterium]|nr:hypothetical protein [Candidatus Moranbacteria bacterium]
MDVQKFQRLVGVMDRLAQTEKGERVLENLSQKLYKLAEGYSPLVFLFALAIAIMADCFDYVPLTIILDSVIGLLLKGFVSFLIWLQLGRIKSTILKKIIIWFIVPIGDTILGFIPLVEFVTPVTTIMVLFSWRSARKEYFKNMEQAQELQDQKGLLSQKKEQYAQDFQTKAHSPENKKSKEKEITNLSAYKKAREKEREALEKAA